MAARPDDPFDVLPPAIPDALVEKVHDLIEGKRVLAEARFDVTPAGDFGVPLAEARFRYSYVLGDHEPYVVRADRDAVRCSCWAARMGQDCAHRYAAMAVWAEQERLG